MWSSPGFVLHLHHAAAARRRHLAATTTATTTTAAATLALLGFLLCRRVGSLGRDRPQWYVAATA